VAKGFGTRQAGRERKFGEMHKFQSSAEPLNKVDDATSEGLARVADEETAWGIADIIINPRHKSSQYRTLDGCARS